MDYTVKELAKLSGVSVRTLHYYDEIGLLCPAYHGENGYRHYGERELLLLQQILFFRELGIELKVIKKILNQSDFDQLGALTNHRAYLEKKLKQTKQLLVTIDTTINHLKGKNDMKHEEMYGGFDSEQQKKYEKELVGRFGPEVQDTIDECRENVGKWSRREWLDSMQDWNEIAEKLVKLLEEPPESPEVQLLIKEHYEWLKTYWTPTKESYIALTEMYLDDKFGKGFKDYHPDFSIFLTRGMVIFAENNL